MTKLFLFIVLIVVTFSCTDSNSTIVNSSANYSIIPKPQSLIMNNGRFIVNELTTISAPKKLSEEAQKLASLLRLKTTITDGKEADVFFNIDTDISNPEGYQLIITYNQITINASTTKGAFYAIQSIRQLLPAEVENNSITTEISLPAVSITDEPRYSYRGMHLDVGRHFFGVEEVKEYIDMIALHKMNTFHWHLTEDQGWRIEIKKYPKLTEIGSIREETAVGLAGTRNAPYTYDGKPYGGFYTQDEIKEVVAYAASKHVTVIPEIELPGHSSAALAAYPEFGNTGGPYEVARRWGIFKEIYAPTEETFTFLKDVLTEVMELFPSEYIHIGGDEVLKDEWKASPYAQELIKRENVGDEHGLQSYFIQRIEKFLNSKGKKIIGWDEILEGGLAPNATVMSWRGTEGGIAAAQQKHDVIMTPGTHCYFDYYQVDSTGQVNEPITGSKRFTTVEKVYSYEPTPSELSDEEAKYILGAQGNMWTEYTPTWDRVQYNTLPRMTALSEVVWTQPEQKSWDDFHSRLQNMAERFDVLGYTYARYAIEE